MSAEAGARNFNRAQVVDQNFVAFVRGWSGYAAGGRARGEAIVEGATLSVGDAIELFESQAIARHQDIEAREMRARGEGYYTIGSAGHEGNALVGRATRHTDIAFLHYRSGAFLAERARQLPGLDFVRDTMLSFAASSDDPISGGRHKVWGSVELCVPPQTSTIASHLPKAVGAAYFMKRAAELGTLGRMPPDSISVCSFGDASLNHAVAQTAFNAAGWLSHQGIPVPVLFVCEDNGIGISVQTPPNWVEEQMCRRYGVAYFAADGLDLVAGDRAVKEAVACCRAHRVPVFLHLKTVRLLGHAGTDAEYGYRSWEEIEAAEARDPLLSSGRLLLESGALTPAQLLDIYEGARARVQSAARYAATRPRLTTAAQVMAPLAPFTPDAVHAEARRAASPEARAQAFGGAQNLPETQEPRHMVVVANKGLHDLMAKYPELHMFGEDIGRKGGVYTATIGLQQRFGKERIFDTLLDETMILGLAIGAGHLGLLPMPEIQYLAYLHNAEDQLRGEACSLQFFSNAQYANPMVVRVQGWSYQKGFGGHFHNDNSIAVLRDIPGIVVATPSRGDDSVKLLRTLTALAKVNGRVCVLLEPIALYMTKDLYAAKDGLWQFPYPAPGEIIEFGAAQVYHEDARDLTILTFANGLYMSLRAAKELREKHNIHARVVDLRWLVPLNEDLIEAEARRTGRVLVVDESRRAAGIAEGIMAVILERCGGTVKTARLNAMDTYVPLGPAADTVLPLEGDVVEAAKRLVG
jgi:2-oxoisovalerate dehydrogenase E1 component